MLINFEATPNLAQGLPVIRDALVFNRNGPDAAFGDVDNSLQGGPAIAVLNGLLGQ